MEVRHLGELLGALSVTMPASDPMNPSKERLVRDLAAQAGLVLRNVRLIEELRASRRRIVTAQDERAKKLERNLHDGAQQQLVALGVQLALARRLAERDAPEMAATFDSLQTAATDALENLRDLARGIYPPLLADQGLLVALEAQARKAALPVEVEGEGIGRYPQEVEAAVYFCCLEALQNVAKYANASSAHVRLADQDGSITFEVTDDGTGFDPEHAARDRAPGDEGPSRGPRRHPDDRLDTGQRDDRERDHPSGGFESRVASVCHARTTNRNRASFSLQSPLRKDMACE